MNRRPLPFTLYALSRRRWLVKAADGSTGEGPLPGDALNRCLAGIAFEGVLDDHGNRPPDATNQQLGGVLHAIADSWGQSELIRAYGKWRVSVGLFRLKPPRGRLRMRGAA